MGGNDMPARETLGARLRGAAALAGVLVPHTYGPAEVSAGPYIREL